MTLVAFGDSTTAIRSTVPKVYAQILQGELPQALGGSVAVHNAGVGGNTTYDALSRINADVLARHPNVVIVQFGINDSWVDSGKQGNPSRIAIDAAAQVGHPNAARGNYTANLNTIVNTLRSSGARVIVMTPNQLQTTGAGAEAIWQNDLLGQYAQVVRKVAADSKVELLDVWQMYADYASMPGHSVNDLLVDSQHPNQAGHRLVADGLKSMLVPEPSVCTLLSVGVLGLLVYAGCRRRGRCIVFVLVLALASPNIIHAAEYFDVFTGGGEGPTGTPLYRIPSLIVAPDGSLIAFAEARRGPGGDAGEPGALIDLVSKRSTDGGTTWSSYQIVARSDRFDYSDPRPVVDATTGKIVLLYTQWPDNAGAVSVPAGIGPESSVLFCRSSADNGHTWSDPLNVNAQVKDPAWFALVSCVGNGIQLRWQTDAARNGRLVDPTWLRDIPGDGTWHFKDVALYSDDHGAHWSRSTVLATPESSEDQIVELTNGDLLLDARQIGGEYRRRAISHDGGATWGAFSAGDVKVTEVNCSLLRYSAKRDGDDRDRILFSAPLGEPAGAGNARSNLGIWTSYDEGKTFINPVQVDSGWAAYSALQKLRDGSVGMLFEETGNTLIRMGRLKLADLESQPRAPHLAEYDGFGNNIDRRRGGIGWSGSWTGNGTPANDHRNELGGKGLSFGGLRAPMEDGRMDLIRGQSVERKLATPINLNSTSTTYLSLLVSRALDTSPDQSSNEALDIYLRNADGVNQAYFGVGSREQFFIGALGNDVTTSDGSLKRAATYMLVLKIVSQDAGQPGNHDQLFLKVFESGDATIPSTDSGVTWTLIGSTNINGSGLIDRLALTSGSASTWSIDELRIGDTFGAVAGIVQTPEPSSAALSSSALIGLLARAWQKWWRWPRV